MCIITFLSAFIGLYKELLIQANIFYKVLGHARYYSVSLTNKRTVLWL